MTISNLPPSPSRADDPAGFSSKMDALLGALPQFVSETNATAADVDQDKADVALLKTQTESVRADAITQTTALRDTTLGYRNDAQSSAVQAAGYRDESQAYRDGAQAAAAAAGSAAGLPSLVGNARKALIVAPGEDAVEWGIGLASGYQEFTSSGTWTKPSEATWVYVEAIGGGGSGGLSIVTAGCNGGSGGEYVSKIARASDLAGSISIVVGAGGAAIVGGSVDSAGNNGGNSSFGMLVFGRGGRGGALSGGTTYMLPQTCELAGTAAATARATPWTVAGPGAPLDNDTTTIRGGGGGGGAGVGTAVRRAGRSQIDGDGGMGSEAPSAAAAGDGQFPGGGGGARTRASTASYSSGDGGDGVVRVWWW